MRGRESLARLPPDSKAPSAEGKALQTLTGAETLLQLETGRPRTDLAIAVLRACTFFIFVSGSLAAPGLNSVLAGLTLAMAIMRNEFPVVRTIILAWNRDSRTNVHADSAPVAGELGSEHMLYCDSVAGP